MRRRADCFCADEPTPCYACRTPAPKARRFRSHYARTFNQIRPSVNAVGAECAARLRYGTLDALTRADFRAEAATAEGMERAEAGTLRRLADSYGRADEFDEAERYVSAVIPAPAPALYGADGRRLKA